MVQATRADKMIPILNNVRVEPDGTTIGSNGKAIIAVSPVSGAIKKQLPLSETANGPLTLPAPFVHDILKQIPKDTRFKGLLEHCDIHEIDKAGTVSVKIRDGRGPKSLDGKKYPRDYTKYKEVFERVAGTKQSVKVVLNRKRFLDTLDTLAKVAPHGGDFAPLWLEFTEENDVVLRTYNPATGQRVLAVMSSLKGGESQWLEESDWEKELCGVHQKAKTRTRSNKAHQGAGNSVKPTTSRPFVRARKR